MDIDVSPIIEQQKLSRFLIGLIVISWIITFFDGFDTNLISFAAPYFASEYHLDRIQLGNIFSIGLVGTLIGGFIFGYAGDRIGRRPAVILATAAFGILTISFALANGYRSLFLLRLIDGIPLGGMLPLAWALNIEYAPKRYRATVVTVIMIGYSVGTALGGPIAIWRALGGVLLMRFTDNRGAIAITTMPLITTLLLLFAGLVDVGRTSFLALNVVISGFLIGGHFGMHSICGLFYPSAYRANGAGWATSIAKIGSIAGPITGGFVLSTSLPVRNIFGVLAICPAIFAVCIYFVGRIHRRMLDRETLVAENIAMPSVLYSSRKAQR